MANLLIGAAIGAINSKATAAAAMRSGVTVLNIVLPLAASVLTGLATGIVAFSSFVRERRLKEIKMLSDDVGHWASCVSRHQDVDESASDGPRTDRSKGKSFGKPQ